MNQARRTFGRARTAEIAPAPVLASQPVFAPQGSGGRSADDYPHRWTVVLLLSPLFLLWGESLFSGTEIITPLSAQWLWFMRGLGLVDGAALWYFLRQSPNYEDGGLRRKIALFIAAIIFMPIVFDALAWRAADWIAFGNSHSKWEEVQYPIMSVHHGRKGRRDTIEIDPFGTGETAGIPIPWRQYSELFANTEGQCVAVKQRRAPNGAIQIKNDGSFTWHEPWPVEVSAC